MIVRTAARLDGVTYIAGQAGWGIFDFFLASV